MDEDIKLRLLQAMDGMISSAGQIKDFAIEEAPKVIQDYVRWGFWSSIVWATTYLVIALILVGAGLRLSSASKKKFKEAEEIGIKHSSVYSSVWTPYEVKWYGALWSRIFGIAMYAVAFIVMVTGIPGKVEVAVKAAAAPRAYIVDVLLNEYRGRPVQVPTPK